MLKGETGESNGASGMYFGTPIANEPAPRKTIAAVTVLSVALISSLLVLGGFYRYNMYLKKQLAATQQTIVQQEGRAIGRIKDQLASETFILREQLLRTKIDSHGVDKALADTQEDLAAALSRAQACEEAYEPLLAELESLKVLLSTEGAGKTTGVQAAEVLRTQAARAGVHLKDFFTFEHKTEKAGGV